jgi:hypothetical protein
MEYFKRLPVKYRKLFGIAFALMGIGLLWHAFSSLGNIENFLKDSVSVNGTVVELVQKIGSGGKGFTGYTYSPEVSFTTSDGEGYIAVSNFGSNPPAYSAGQEVNILYNSKNPYDIRINNFFEIWSASLVSFIMGVVFSLLGLWIVFFLHN